MLDHHIQRSIVYRLALSETLRFSELKPDELENKLFTYHLKKVVRAGLVTKLEDGSYRLTPEGRRVGIQAFESQQDLLDRAFSVLFLVVRRKSDGAWLLYRRKAHPLIERTGFMHAIPTVEETSIQTAVRTLEKNTSIKGAFHVLGSGYFRTYDNESLEGFTHFTLLVCEDATGEIKQQDEYADYYWILKPNFSAHDMLPNSAILAKAYQKGKSFFLEQTLHIN